jgi:hypothetical protein
MISFGIEPAIIVPHNQTLENVPGSCLVVRPMVSCGFWYLLSVYVELWLAFPTLFIANIYLHYMFRLNWPS